MSFGKSRAPKGWPPPAKTCKPASAVRQEWTAAVQLADEICSAAIKAGEAGDEAVLHQPGQALSRLMVALRDLAAENFPVGTAACRAMAGSFLHLARYIVQPSTGPEARTACAHFLAGGVRQLEAALVVLRTEEAQGWRTQMGERD